MSPAAIEVRALRKRYADLTALDAVDLRVEPGEFFGLLGPNGAGKTTLISIVAGLTRATEGCACVMGHDVVREYRAARANLGVVPQELVFDPFFTVRETLRIQSKIMGNLVFLLLPPISALQFFAAYVLAAVVRGAIVGLGVFLVTLALAPVSFHAPLWIFVFGFLGAALLGVLGLIAGILSDKFDQLAAFQNFIILPATFLSGVFYSVHSLPAFWQTFSRFNPFFYMIDGFRFGFFAQSDTSPWISLAVVASALLGASGLVVAMLRR